MRSLVILTNTSRTVKGKRPEARYTGLAVRPEEVAGATDGLGETVYLASERQLPDGGVEIQVFIGNANAEDTNTVSCCCCFLRKEEQSLTSKTVVKSFDHDLACMQCFATFSSGGTLQ